MGQTQTPPKKRGRQPKPRQEKQPVVIEIPELPPPVNRNKKSVSWDQDPEILARLATVASMMNQKAKAFQIKEAMGYTMRSAYRDIARVYTLWRRESMQEVDDARAKSIAQYTEIQTRAWEGYRKVSAYINASNIPNPRLMKEQQNWLKLAMDAESEIASLQGTKITKLNVDARVEHSTNARDLTDEQLIALALSMKGS